MTRRSNAVNCSRSHGFTLIELLVVVAIISLLMAILLPALQRARAQGKDAVDKSNLHQLAVGTTYYAQENTDRLPYIPGLKKNPDGSENAPYIQYHQIFLLWPYIKERKILLCPSAIGETSTPSYDAPGVSYTPSQYVVRKADSLFVKAMKQQWWPDIKPSDYPGDRIPTLFTEYWYNDWSSGANNQGRPVPRISGGLLGKIPLPAYAVAISDAFWWEQNPAKLRHGGGIHLGFVDGHADRLTKLKYLDLESKRAGQLPKDFDPFGNRPFYAWGLTREGFDTNPE